MPFRIKVSLFILGFLLVLVLVVPLVVPIPPPQGARPLAEFAEAEHVSVNGVALHTERYGTPSAAAPTFVLLHDYAFSSYTFEEFGPLLAEHGAALAFDRPGFGLSERPAEGDGGFEGGANPYTAEAQVALTVGLLDELGVSRAVLVGNGMGGHIALDTAIAHPERVAGLVLIDTAVDLEQGREAPRWFLDSPQMRRLGPVFLRQLAEGPGEQLLTGAFADPDLITAEIREKHARTTSVEGWDRALFQISRHYQPSSLSGRLGAVSVPALVVTGAGLPNHQPEVAERLTAELPGAELVELPGCGRVPQLECPHELMGAVEAWLEGSGLAARAR